MNFPFDLIYRENWGALDYVRGNPLNNSNVFHILLFHTRGNRCNRSRDCMEIVRKLQNQSIHEQNIDIPFNFLIGDDGQTYEGRGWSHETGLSNIPNPNNITLSIGFLGDFTHHKPSTVLMEETQSLIRESIKRRKILSNYKIFGVRNKTVSELDGKGIFDYISNWIKWESIIDVY